MTADGTAAAGGNHRRSDVDFLFGEKDGGSDCIVRSLCGFVL